MADIVLWRQVLEAIPPRVTRDAIGRWANYNQANSGYRPCDDGSNQIDLRFSSSSDILLQISKQFQSRKGNNFNIKTEETIYPKLRFIDPPVHSTLTHQPVALKDLSSDTRVCQKKQILKDMSQPMMLVLRKMPKPRFKTAIQMANVTDLLSKFVYAIQLLLPGFWNTCWLTLLPTQRMILKGITTRSWCYHPRTGKAINHDTSVSKDTMPPEITEARKDVSTFLLFKFQSRNPIL
ncbi:hypothetical protein Tco_0304865 [Tanacetum coccineum]